MKGEVTLRHEFVEFIPEELDNGMIYVSIRYATAAHKCCCGCGQEVVTPLSPTDWKLVFDGETISLDPSIGNWSFPCQSHYWITRNGVKWARRWTPKEVRAGRSHDAAMKDQYFSTLPKQNVNLAPRADPPIADELSSSIWHRLTNWLLGK